MIIFNIQYFAYYKLCFKGHCTQFSCFYFQIQNLLRIHQYHLRINQLISSFEPSQNFQCTNNTKKLCAQSLAKEINWQYRQIVLQYTNIQRENALIYFNNSQGRSIKSIFKTYRRLYFKLGALRNTFVEGNRSMYVCTLNTCLLYTNIPEQTIEKQRLKVGLMEFQSKSELMSFDSKSLYSFCDASSLDLSLRDYV